MINYIIDNLYASSKEIAENYDYLWNNISN